MPDGAAHIACGSIAGAVGKIFEYPFDTTKVRLQTQDQTNPKYSGAIDCLRKTIQQEGFYGLYRGISSPIFGAAVENAVLFYTYASLSQLLQSIEPYGISKNAQVLLQGCGAGIAASFVLTPIELVKCKVQVAHLAGVSHKSIPTHIIDVWKSEKLLGFWKGQTGTLLREAGGSAAWFGSYEFVKSKLSHWSNVGSSLVAGACAGVAYNITLFPADTVKSVMQTENMMGRPSQGFLGTLRSLYYQGGIKSLYRGCTITCARAAPSSALIFMTYDQLSKYII